MIQDQQIIFDPERLQMMNETYQARLLDEPGDIPTRVALAWCLLFQSLYQSHQQDFWRKLIAQSEGEDERFQARLLELRSSSVHSTPDARRLLKDSLLQAATAAQFCLHSDERANAAKIQELVTLLGEGKAVVEVEREATHILNRLARAIYANRGEHESREEEEV